MRLFQLWAQFIRTALIREMEFRAQFIFSVVVDLLYVGFIFFMATVFFTNTNEIAGWTKEEVYILIATWAVVHELFNALFWFGLSRLSELIRVGDLDILFIRPMHVIWQLLFSRMSLSHVIQVCIHFPLLIYFIVQSDIETSAWSIAGYAMLSFCALLIFFSIHLFLQSFSFWFIHIDNVKYLYHSFTDMGRHPTAVFKTLQLLFFTIIPVAYMGNMQVLFLIDGQSMEIFFKTIVVAFISVLIALAIYTIGSRSYSSASS